MGGMTVTPDQACARFEILDRVHLYCHAVDRRRWDLMAEVFHEDATYQFFSIEGGWRAFVDAAKALIDPMVQTHHQVSNSIIRFEGQEVAFSETYLRAYHVVDAHYPADTFLSLPGGGAVWVGARYVDRFEKRDGNWRIAHRHGLVDWTRRAPGVSAGLEDFVPSWCGRKGDVDPSLIVTRRPRAAGGASIADTGHAG
jgi:3-phenylpropionate/cinnamic acid dioxygenase small subunit